MRGAVGATIWKVATGDVSYWEEGVVSVILRHGRRGRWSTEMAPAPLPGVGAALHSEPGQHSEPWTTRSYGQLARNPDTLIEGHGPVPALIEVIPPVSTFFSPRLA